MTNLYTFETCRVDKSAREVWIGDALRPVAPMVFNLLVYLIEHRSRVVGRDELLEQVWHGAYLSDSAVSRAVMKARQAIDDGSDEPRLIRTVHRVGYRFVGSVREENGLSDRTVLASRAGPNAELANPSGDASCFDKIRFAMLPFEDRTDDPKLGWIKLGLLSLVNQALETDERLHVASVTTVLKALEVDDSGLAGEALAPVLSRLIGAQCVCGVTVHQTEQGFAFEYWLIGAAGLHCSGHLQGHESTALCQQLVRRIERDLFDTESSDIRLQSVDPWANQAFARAMEARELKNGESALKLIRVVLDLHPNNPVVQFGYLEILCLLADARALEIGRVQLDEALADRDDRRAAEIHRLLALTLFDLEGSTSTAQHHSRESMRLAAPFSTSYWAQRIFNNGAVAAFRRGDHDEALLLLEQVEAVSERVGNHLQLVLAKTNRGTIEALAGNLVTARALWEATLQLCKNPNYRARVMPVNLNLSEISAATGLLDLAIDYCDAVLVDLPKHQIRGTALQFLADVCVRYGEARRLDKVEQALELLGALAADTGGLSTSLAMIADAQRHVCQAEFDAASEKLDSALKLALQHNFADKASQWAPLLIHNEMRAGRYLEAGSKAAEFLALLPTQTSADIVGMRLHAHALALHRDGNAAEARSALAEALASMHPSRWSVHIRLDAAWLDIERGDLDAARRMLDGTFSWLQAHPIGQFVDSRLQFAVGRYNEASSALQACMVFVQSEDDFVSVMVEALRLGGSGIVSDLPRARCLPSVL